MSTKPHTATHFNHPSSLAYPQNKTKPIQTTSPHRHRTRLCSNASMSWIPSLRSWRSLPITTRQLAISTSLGNFSGLVLLILYLRLHKRCLLEHMLQMDRSTSVRILGNGKRRARRKRSIILGGGIQCRREQVWYGLLSDLVMIRKYLNLRRRKKLLLIAYSE